MGEVNEKGEISGRGSRLGVGVESRKPAGSLPSKTHSATQVPHLSLRLLCWVHFLCVDQSVSPTITTV